MESTQQFSLPGFYLDARPSDRLLFAVRPDADATRRIARLRTAGDPVREDRLHITLNHLGDYHGLPPALVAQAIEAGEATLAAPFPVALDRVMNFNRGIAVLSGEADIAGMVAFQRTLGVAMSRAGLGRLVEARFTPHVTISYNDPAIEERAVDPIGWIVGEFLLIHSLIGRTEHNVLRSWSLRG
jgi:2'-5' RNA ligase